MLIFRWNKVDDDTIGWDKVDTLVDRDTRSNVNYFPLKNRKDKCNKYIINIYCKRYTLIF